MADATVEAYTEAVNEAVDVNVAVAAAEEEVPHSWIDRVATDSDYWIWHFVIQIWHLAFG